MAAFPVALALVLVACGSSRSDRPRAEPDPWSIDAAAAVANGSGTGSPGPAEACERLSFHDHTSLAEASGADWVPADALRPAHVLVVGDSGNVGAFVAVDAESGKALAHGRLPMYDEATDDLEGLAVTGDDVYAITSSGWMRRWRRDADDWGFTMVDKAYPLATVGAPDGLVCTVTNCGMNYEGLCLRDDAVPDGACAGFAASKATGRLVCLVRDAEGRLALDGSRTIAVSAPETLTSCDFAPEGDVLWAGTNTFGGNTVYRIRDWDTAPTIETVEQIGPGFPESMAVAPGGIVYRFSDTGGAPSLQGRYRCK